MKIRTLEKDGTIRRAEYSEKECERIFAERDRYWIRCVHEYGEDYGGSQCEENRRVSHRKIGISRTLVRDGHFCGVVMNTKYDDYNGGCVYHANDSVLLLDRPGKTVKGGSSFSSDDHSHWDYMAFSIEKKPEKK